MKQKVAVVALHTKEGKITPLFIIWENNEKYPIDYISKIEKAASLKHGGIGIRYTIRVQTHQRWLYYENPGWFIEKIE